jgi:RNA polymerase sigma factor (TIGR02999 family)
MSEVTQVLSAIEQGDRSAADQLLPLVYDEFRKLAAHRLDQEKPGQTLEATMLVHVAYLRWVGMEQSKDWRARRQFFAAAAQAMRKILMDSARRKRRTMHGAGRHHVGLDDEVREPPSDRGALPALDEALTRLPAEDTEAAGIVEFRSFAGLSVQEAACLDRHRRPHDAPVRDNDGRAGAQVRQKVRRLRTGKSPGAAIGLGGAGSSR